MESYKVIFSKKENGRTYTSAGYYKDAADFKERNPTMFFDRMTGTKKKPKKVKE